MIYSLVNRRIEDVQPGSFATGVSRFDSMLRRVFPELISITPQCIPKLTPEDVVITDNHLALLVPGEVPTVVVHHGCAQTHWDRDPTWRNESTAQLCKDQQAMFWARNRTYVAPSAWVRGEFARHYGLPADYATVVINWVPRLERYEPPRINSPWKVQAINGRPPVVIGDWRDANKGAGIWEQVAKRVPGALFCPLKFTTDEERAAFYRDADLYLCLSLSEGGSYSMCDAEAAYLPIVSTSVGNVLEFPMMPLFNRNPEHVASEVRSGLMMGRRAPSFYDTYTFDHWAAAWRGVVEKARAGAEALL